MICFRDLLSSTVPPPPVPAALQAAQVWLRELSIAEAVAHLRRIMKELRSAGTASAFGAMSTANLAAQFDHESRDDPDGRPFAEAYFRAPFLAYGSG